MSNSNFLTEASMILDYGYGATPTMNENAFDNRIALDAKEDDQFINQVEETETETDNECASVIAEAIELGEKARTLIEAKPDAVRALSETDAKRIFVLANLDYDYDAINQAYADFMGETEAPVAESVNSMDYLASRMLRDPGMLEDEE